LRPHIRGHAKHEAVVKRVDVAPTGEEVGESINAQAEWRGVITQGVTDVLLEVFDPLQGEEG
jgi:hypothetical protein